MNIKTVRTKMEEGECQSGEGVVDGPRKQPRQTGTSSTEEIRGWRQNFSVVLSLILP